MPDVPSREMVVKGYVFEVASAESLGSAVDLALSLLKSKVAALFVGNGFGQTLTFKDGNFQARYSALSSDPRFKILSSPSLRVRSGDHARVASQDPRIMNNSGWLLDAVSLTATIRRIFYRWPEKPGQRKRFAITYRR